MKIIDGAKDFKTNVYPEMKEKFSKLESGQQPEVLFITCSDSRVVPNLLTQTDPGELFIIRNAGNIVPKPGSGELGVEATIQYAVDVLKVDHIVVCGHSHCGAVSGLLNLDSLESLPIIRDWVKRSEAILENDDCKTDIPKAIAANVALQLEHLKLHACVKSAMDEGRLELHGWVYHFESGAVDVVTGEGVEGLND